MTWEGNGRKQLWFNLRYCHLPGETEENHEKSHSSEILVTNK
jgi:hypothetical protein